MEGLTIGGFTLARRNTSRVSASLLLRRLKISVLFMSTMFTLSMNIMKSPGSR